MKCQEIFTSALLLLTYLLQAVWSDEVGIKCYVCNSARDPRCGDPFDPRTIELVDCNQFMPGRNASVCRKNVQKLSLGKREDFRIVRTCGFIVDNKIIGGSMAQEENEGEDQGDKNSVRTAEGRCYTRAGTFEVMVTYCDCNKAGCNPADKVSIPSLILIASLFFTRFF